MWCYCGIRPAAETNVAAVETADLVDAGRRTSRANVDKPGDPLPAGRHGSRERRSDRNDLSFRFGWHAKSGIHGVSGHDARVGHAAVISGADDAAVRSTPNARSTSATIRCAALSRTLQRSTIG